MDHQLDAGHFTRVATESVKELTVVSITQIFNKLETVMKLTEMYYAVYDRRSTTGYKCLGVVKVKLPVGSPRGVVYQVVHEKLGLKEEDIWIQVSVEIQHILHPLN